MMLVLVLCVLLAMAGCAEERETMPTSHTQPPTQALPVTEPENEATNPETMPSETAIPEETMPEETEPVAEQIEEGYVITLDGEDITDSLRPQKNYQINRIGASERLMITSEVPFGAIYLKWHTHPGRFTLTWGGGSMDCGAESFLHDYIRLPEVVNTVEFVFAEKNGAQISEISLYTLGTAPEGVQDWLQPCDTADILVFPTHSDDDALFFGGVISYYAIEKGLTVQTAFMTDHVEEPVRNHERLDGLWEMGVRHYPIVGSAWDHYTESVYEAYIFHANDDILGWQVEQIRRFKPLVILGHDLNGEYGHKQHIVNAEYLVQAVELAADPEQCAESAAQYGAWDTPKHYLHLYGENSIVFDVNTPLEKDPERRTPIAIADAAYRCHRSQQRYWFVVSQDPNTPLDCTRFGLYRTRVGYDSGADMMENIDLKIRHQ
jgi:LmbE family N-acetylglucosaminyl deacetylase